MYTNAPTPMYLNEDVVQLPQFLRVNIFDYAFRDTSTCGYKVHVLCICNIYWNVLKLYKNNIGCSSREIVVVPHAYIPYFNKYNVLNILVNTYLF